MSDRKNIKVSEDEFRELKADKPEGVTWGYYLMQLKEKAEDDKLLPR